MAGAEDAEAVLVEHRRLIEAVARRVCAGHPDDVDDVVQEASLRIYRSLHTVKHEQALVAWVMQTTRNAAINYLSRGRWKHQRAEVSIDEVAPDGGAGYAPPQLRVDAPDPTEIDRHTHITRVRRAVDGLPPMERRAIQARFGIGASEASYGTVAREFNRSVTTVERATRHAKRHLRQALWPRDRSPQDDHGDHDDHDVAPPRDWPNPATWVQLSLWRGVPVPPDRHPQRRRRRARRRTREVAEISTMTACRPQPCLSW